ncbi:hypothetical protein [Enterobacter mori]|uniref:hypothetical protein n=1 Tax=Enterobacter mori TaxID=539813 RepID=UPI003B83AC42
MNSAHKKSAPCPERLCERVAYTYRAITVSDVAGDITRIAGSGQNQLFGSIPRLSSSRRSSRLIHPERLSSPSSFMARLSLSKRSASSRSCTANLSFLLSSVDIVNLKNDNAFEGDNVYQCHYKDNAPPASEAQAGRLTTSVTTDNEAAMKNSTTHPQGRLSKNTWLYIFVVKEKGTARLACTYTRVGREAWSAVHRGTAQGASIRLAAKIRVKGMPFKVDITHSASLDDGFLSAFLIKYSEVNHG